MCLDDVWQKKSTIISFKCVIHHQVEDTLQGEKQQQRYYNPVFICLHYLNMLMIILKDD